MFLASRAHQFVATLMCKSIANSNDNLDNIGLDSPFVLNAVAGLLYSMSLIGLDPNMPDPTLK